MRLLVTMFVMLCVVNLAPAQRIEDILDPKKGIESLANAVLGKAKADQARRSGAASADKHNASEIGVSFNGQTVLVRPKDIEISLPVRDEQTFAISKIRQLFTAQGATPLRTPEELDEEARQRDRLASNEYVRTIPRKGVITGEPRYEINVYAITAEASDQLDLRYGRWWRGINLYLSTNLVNVVLVLEIWDWEKQEQVASYLAIGSASTTEDFGLVLQDIAVGYSGSREEKAHLTAFNRALESMKKVLDTKAREARR